MATSQQKISPENESGALSNQLEEAAVTMAVSKKQPAAKSKESLRGKQTRKTKKKRKPASKSKSAIEKAAKPGKIDRKTKLKFRKFGYDPQMLRNVRSRRPFLLLTAFLFLVCLGSFAGLKYGGERERLIENVGLSQSGAVAGDGQVSREQILASDLFKQEINGIMRGYFLFLGACLLLTGLMLFWLFRSQRDIRAVAQAQKKTKERLQLAMDGAHCGVWDWDLERDHVFITAPLGRILGLGEEDMTIEGKTFFACVHEADHSGLKTAINDAPYHHQIDHKFRVTQPDGTRYNLQIRGQTLRRGNHGPVNRVGGVALDFTHTHAAEMKLHQIQNRLTDAIESMSGPFALWDSGRKLIAFNTNFFTAFDLPPEVMTIGAPYDEISTAIRDAIIEHQPSKRDPGMWDVKLSDGRWLQITERQTSEDGLVIYGADVTMLHRHAQALQEKQTALINSMQSLEESRAAIAELASKYEEEKTRAEEANRSKTEFLANMSHELRTPLNAINGFSQMMLDETFGSIGHPKYAEYAADILNSGKHLLDLINDILDMSKIEAGKMKIVPSLISTEQVAKTCIRLIEMRAKKKQIEIQFDDQANCKFEADMRAIKQVLLNLLTNAVKFTPDHGKVKLTIAADKQYVFFEVADSGCGMSKEELAHLGKPFHQADDNHTRARDGSGLGLALSQALLNLHGGGMKIRSQSGVGTIVTFAIPLKSRSPISNSKSDKKTPILT